MKHIAHYCKEGVLQEIIDFSKDGILTGVRKFYKNDRVREVVYYNARCQVIKVTTFSENGDLSQVR